jgi:WD repeat-containing protein 19
LAVVVNKKSLLLFLDQDYNNPIELSMKYGNINNHFFAKDRIVIGFENGMITQIQFNDLGKELGHVKMFKDQLYSLLVSPAMGRVLVCGDGTCKVQELSDLSNTVEIIQIEGGKTIPMGVQCSDDGQFMTIQTRDNQLHTYVAKSAMLYSCYFDRFIYTKGLSELGIHDYRHGKQTTQIEIQVEVECVAIGPSFVAYSHSDTVHYVSITESECRTDLLEYEYPALRKQANNLVLGTMYQKTYHDKVVQVALNKDHVFIRFEGGDAILHPLTPEFLNGNYQAIQFAKEENIRFAKMLTSFLVYLTSAGTIVLYDLAEYAPINTFQHGKPISRLFLQPGIGNKMIYVDEKDAFIHSPLGDKPFHIKNWDQFTHALWETDSNRSNQFIAWTDTKLAWFVYHQTTMRGKACIQIKNTTRLPFGYHPIMLKSGIIYCQNMGGKIEEIPLAPDLDMALTEFTTQFVTEEEQGSQLCLLYAVGRMDDVWKLSEIVQSKKAWLMVAEAMLMALDVKNAKRIYKTIIRDVGMVLNLDRIEQTEEIQELVGHIAVLFGEFNLAQGAFLNSSRPKEAMYLWKDLLEWEEALSLAKRFAKEEIAHLCNEYGSQLEMEGRYGEAHVQFDQSLQHLKYFAGSLEEHNELEWQAKAGLCRMTFAMGDLGTGMKMIDSISDKKLLEDCVNILQGMKQLPEAAILLEKAEQFDRAAEIWIELRNWSRISKISDRFTNPKLFRLLGDAKLKEKQYAEAASAYEKGKDYDSVISILLDHLHDLTGGAELVRKTQSRESAKKVAQLYLQDRQFDCAIEFYLIAGLQQQAFQLASEHNLVDLFAESLGDQATVETYTQIARHFEGRRQYYEAGKYHLLALHYKEALDLFLKCPNNEKAIELAIETIGEAKNDQLTHVLIDFLMGEVDGIPKDAKYIFKLYMSLGQYKEASRTAIIIAREEQSLGNYRQAHDLLLDNYIQLKKTNSAVPAELNRMLMLLHSYMCVKTLVRMEDHYSGARMLIRVSNHISKFPAHAVPILTSTVIECYRSGLKREAFEFASILMRSENRQKIDPKFKSKIEKIVR